MKITVNTLSFDVDKTMLTCFQSGDGKITIKNVIGTSPFTYYLMDSAGAPYTGNNYPPAANTVQKDTNIHIFDGLSAGTYKVKVVDANGCEVVR